MFFIDKRDCTGCSACMNVCPKDCITMKKDSEGFEFPHIDEALCVHCNRCKASCPVINKKYTKPKISAVYAMRLADSQKLFDSTSGGAFTLLAEYFIKNKGIVYGVIIDEDFKVKHVACETLEDLEKIKKSKYVQSSVGYIYRDIKKVLHGSERKVLFSGTPCQVEGLLRYLGKDYDNLYTVDLLCHGVPSGNVWDEYIQYQNKRKKLRSFLFKCKTRGWGSWNVLLQYSDGQEDSIPFEDDSFCQMYLTSLDYRYACYRCRFRNIRQKSCDATLGDLWGVEKLDKKMDDNKGASLFIIHTEKMRQLYEKISDDCYSRRINLWSSLAGNAGFKGALGNNFTIPNERQEFYQELKKYGYEEIAKKYETDIFKLKEPDSKGWKEYIELKLSALERDIKFRLKTVLLLFFYDKKMKEEFDVLQAPYEVPESGLGGQWQ